MATVAFCACSCLIKVPVAPKAGRSASTRTASGKTSEEVNASTASRGESTTFVS